MSKVLMLVQKQATARLGTKTSKTLTRIGVNCWGKRARRKFAPPPSHFCPSCSRFSKPLFFGISLKYGYFRPFHWKKNKMNRSNIFKIQSPPLISRNLCNCWLSIKKKVKSRLGIKGVTWCKNKRLYFLEIFVYNWNLRIL